MRDAKIETMSLARLMGERFGRYPKSIIQDRALPDLPDVLTQVQRRTLYSIDKYATTYDN